MGKGAVAITAVAVGEPLRLIVPCGGLRRAPTVATGISSKVAGLPRTSRPTALANSREGAGDLARPVVAGLFVAAAMLLLGAAIWARRHGSNVEDEDVAPAMESPDEPGTRLTLVRMPHESGP